MLVGQNKVFISYWLISNRYRYQTPVIANKEVSLLKLYQPVREEIGEVFKNVRNWSPGHI